MAKYILCIILIACILWLSSGMNDKKFWNDNAIADGSYMEKEKLLKFLKENNFSLYKSATETLEAAVERVCTGNKFEKETWLKLHPLDPIVRCIQDVKNKSSDSLM